MIRCPFILYSLMHPVSVRVEYIVSRASQMTLLINARRAVGGGAADHNFNAAGTE